LLGYDAVRLFVERAQNAQPGFVLSDANASAVAAICARLDGMPLAIELAAARVQGLQVEDIAARLDQRLALLTRGSRVATRRHQTLRELLDWSYELLDAPEQTLLGRLAVFAGGFDLAAVETVCASPGMDADSVRDVLLQLADKSLVVSDADYGVGRFHLLETVREYAAERLTARGELHPVAGRHAAYFLDQAEAADAGLSGTSSVTCYLWLERERENLRAALHWHIDDGQAEAALRFAVALGWFWYMHGYLSEARTTFAIVLGLPDAMERTPSRSRACFLAAAAALFLGDYSAAESLAQQALSIGREIGALQQIGQALTLLANLRSDRGDPGEARVLLGESLAACQQAGDEWSTALALYWLGVVSSQEGDTIQARRLHEQALAMRRVIGDFWAVGASLGRLAELAAQVDDGPAIQTYAAEALAIARQVGYPRGVARNLWCLGAAALGQGDTSKAEQSFQESLAIWLETGERAFVPRGLEGVAAVAARQGDSTMAVQLAGAAAGLRELVGSVPTPVERLQLERWYGSARAELGPRAAAAAWDRGRIMSADRAAEAAREWVATFTAAPTPADQLTAHQQAIAILIVRGCTNEEIALQLSTSPADTKAQIAHILDRLGLHSRAQIAAWAVANRLESKR
jgi:DNA-binding CsgD family transcriptional regulator